LIINLGKTVSLDEVLEDGVLIYKDLFLSTYITLDEDYSLNWWDGCTEHGFIYADTKYCFGTLLNKKSVKRIKQLAKEWVRDQWREICPCTIDNLEYDERVEKLRT